MLFSITRSVNNSNCFWQIMFRVKADFSGEPVVGVIIPSMNMKKLKKRYAKWYKISYNDFK